MSLQEQLIKIQSELKAPKGQKNNFGNYKYRNCEDILEAVKPLLKKYECDLTITDDIVLIGDRYYVRADAQIRKLDENISVRGFAREALSKKGMDESQITGAASSYARKYALNGLFLIDDTKDADSQEPVKEASKPASKRVTPKATPLPLKNSYIQTWSDWIDKGFKAGKAQAVRDHIEKMEPVEAVKEYYTKRLQEEK